MSQVAAPGTAGPAGAAGDPGAPARAKPGHLHQIDLVRLLTFICVIGVHGVPLATNPNSALAGGVTAVLHFTRDTFFLLSAFVLVHVHYRRDLRLLPFWRRRFYYIGVPYVVWTAIYFLWYSGAQHQVGTAHDFLVQLVTGTGEYHLYFLLVSMQLYLVFPLLLWLLRRTAGHHLALFVISGALEVVILALVLYVQWPAGTPAAVQTHAYALLPTYQFYFIAGGLAAIHFARLRAWVEGHTREVLFLLAGAAAVYLGVYLLRLHQTNSPGIASDPLQPSLVLWSLAVTIAFLAAGCWYANHRRGGWLVRVVDAASVASFGIYLVHPLVLNGILGRWLAYGLTPIPQALAAVILWAATFIVSLGFAVLVLRTPLALPLTGRVRQTRRPKTPEQTPAARETVAAGAEVSARPVSRGRAAG